MSDCLKKAINFFRRLCRQRSVTTDVESGLSNFSTKIIISTALVPLSKKDAHPSVPFNLSIDDISSRAVR